MILQQPFAIPSFGFLPTKIPGCKLWLKADAIGGLSNNDPVATWADSSGNGNDFIQGTAGNKPLYQSSVINSLPTVLFDGTDDFMSRTADISIQPISVFVVLQPTLNTASQKTYACFFHTKSSCFLVARLSTNFWGTFTSSDLSSGNALTSGTSYLLQTTAATSSTFLYQRGVQVATAAITESSPGGTAAGLGKDLVNANRQYAGHIAEVIVYDTVLSSGNRILVENFLIAKYAL